MADMNGDGSTVRQALAMLERQLSDRGVPTPQVDAELLVRHVVGWSRTRLLTSGDEPLDPAAGRRLQELGQRRAAREPLQLIVGTVGFRRLELLVRPGVFIPRPETEVLAGAAIDRTPRDGIVVEPCTGTGAVACAVAQETTAAAVHAVDAAPAAVALARQNALRNGVTITVALGDLLEPVPAGLRGRVDVLVSNPPYLAAAELAEVEPEVSRWDPAGALIAGPTGHEVSDRLIALAGRWLRPGGWLLLEVADTRARATAARCATAGFEAVRVETDLTGRDRVVRARRPA